MQSDSKKLIEDSIKQLEEDIDKGYSDRMKQLLEWKAKFHQYSFWNTILIWIQRPDAEYVKGFKQWNDMGYRVNKGSKAIRILAPRLCVYIERETADGTKEKVFWKNMSEIERKMTAKHKQSEYFIDVSVFDIKDTDCKEYPTFFYNMGNDYEEMYVWLIDLFSSQDHSLTIEEVQSTNGSNGCYIDIYKKIHILKRDYNSMLFTLLHEVAHYYCYKEIQNYEGLYNYKEGELHAESICFIVAKVLGLYNPLSRDYIINWKGNSKKLRENLSVIDRISSLMIKNIEKEMDVKEMKEVLC